MLYTVKDQSLDIPDDVLLIPEFQAIWDRDKSPGKTYAIRDLIYVYYFAEYMSPYANMTEETRKITIFEDFIKDNKWTEDDLIRACITKYQLLTFNAAMELVRDARTACSKLSKHFREVDLTSKDKLGKLQHKSTDLSKNLREVGSIAISLQTLEEQVKKGISSKKIKGQGGKASKFEE